MTISPTVLALIMPAAPRAWLVALSAEMPRWGIDTDVEVASFVAQIAHESVQLTRLQENLSYSAERLVQVWPKRFPSIAAARPFARNPARLANHVYANRLGNGPPASDDGWRYRGRGPIQLTGKNNYRACGLAIDAPLLEHPDALLTPTAGIRSACWFWNSRGLDVLDDDEDVRAETRIVNGGTHGLSDRQRYFDVALKALRNTPTEATV